jgi:CHAD domain-containing protein
VATARPVELKAEEPYADAAARTIAVRTDELIEHSKGVLDLSDVEHLHAMRVASRRLRAALEVFEPCFPRKQYRRTLRDVKALADALGERRDRDVTIKAVRGFGGEMPGADQPGIDTLVDRLRAEQRQANQELEPLVTWEALAELRRRLGALAEAAR